MVLLGHEPGQLFVCLSVLTAAAAALLFIGLRGFTQEECIHCRRAMGFHFNEEFVRPMDNSAYDEYMKYRVCKSCNMRSHIVVFKKPTRR